MRFLGVLVAVIGALLIILGVIGVPLAILGALDPAQAQLANDPDPFGTPPSNSSYLLMAGAYFVAGVFGVLLVRWSKRHRVAAQQGAPADGPASRARG